MKSAADILKEAASVIEERGKLRDKEDGERSMSRAVEAYTALRGEKMCGELDGWLFLCVLKLARATAGKPHLDDWTDLAGYAALAAEHVSNETSQFWIEHALENGLNICTQEAIDAYAKETEKKRTDQKEEMGLYGSLVELYKLADNPGWKTYDDLYDSENWCPYTGSLINKEG